MPPDVDVLTIAEVAQRLRIRVAAAYALIREGQIPKIPNLGRRIRVSAQALEEMIAQRDRPGGGPQGIDVSPNGLRTARPIHNDTSAISLTPE
jgi:excisionase family DNA binding protein